MGSPCSRILAFSKVLDFLIPKLPNLDPIAGVKTNAYNTEPDKTINNVVIIGLKNCPETPGIKNIGTKIDKVVPIEIVTGQNILFAENLYASILSKPSAIFLSAYSTTTTQPSINIPKDINSPKQTIKLKL